MITPLLPTVMSLAPLAYIPGPVSALPYYLSRGDRKGGAKQLPLALGNIAHIHGLEKCT